MPLYFLLLDHAAFHQRLRPALAASWRQRSFEPCRAFCADLLPAALAFAERYHTGRDGLLLAQVAGGLPFDRDFWRALAGELLWFSAADIPELQTAPDTLCALLAPDQVGQDPCPRDRFAPIQQAHYGARDLVFGGGYYRPEHAGYNDAADVARLAEYLAAVDPQRWTPAELAVLPDLADKEERAEELEYVRDWFPALRELYQQARAHDQIVVCELLSPSAV
jgi:Domain of unknown function (DUF1877)